MHEEYMVETGRRKRHKNADNAIKYSKRFDIYKKVDDSALGYSCEASWEKGKFSSYSIHGGPSKTGMFFDDLNELDKWLGKKLYNDLIAHKLSSDSTIKSRKLRASWSIELEEDLKNMHGIDISAELSKALVKDIQTEIDNDIIKRLIEICEREAPDMVLRELVKEHGGDENE